MVWDGPTMIWSLDCLGHCGFPCLWREQSCPAQATSLPLYQCLHVMLKGGVFSSSRESSGSLRHDKGTGVSRAHRHGRRPAPRRSAGNSHVNKRVWPDVLARPRTSASSAPVSEPSLCQVLEELAVLRGEVAELCASAPPGPEHDGEVRPGPSGIPP